MTVWGALLSLVHTTVVPAVTVRVLGVKQCALPPHPVSTTVAAAVGAALTGRLPALARAAAASRAASVRARVMGAPPSRHL